VRRCAIGALLATFALALTMGGEAPAAVVTDVSGRLVVIEVDTVRKPDLSVVLAPPRLLSGRILAQEAFHVSVDGEERPITVTPLPIEGLQVAIALDPAVSPQVFRSAQAAVLDFLLRLPPGTRVAVVSAGPQPAATQAPTADFDVVTAAVGDLAAGQPGSLADALEVAESQFQPGGRRALVVFSGGASNVSTFTLAPLVRRLETSGTDVYAVELSEPGGGDALTHLAGKVGGQTMRVLPTELVGAYQRVADLLLNQYRVTFQAHTEGQVRVQVRVSGDQISEQSTFSVDLSPPQPLRAAPIESDERAGGRALAEPLGAVLVIAFAIVGGLLLIGVGRAGLRSHPRDAR
jgi:hypothetical protein